MIFLMKLVHQTAEIESNARYIYLPIPQQVTDSISVDYAQDTMNPLQAAGLAAASGLIGEPKPNCNDCIGGYATAAGTAIGPDTKKMLTTILRRFTNQSTWCKC